MDDKLLNAITGIQDGMEIRLRFEQRKTESEFSPCIEITVSGKCNTGKCYNATSEITQYVLQDALIDPLSVICETIDRLQRTINNEISVEEKSNELWDADPNCKHNIVSCSGGGVRCTKCGGWCCW